MNGVPYRVGLVSCILELVLLREDEAHEQQGGLVAQKLGALFREALRLGEPASAEKHKISFMFLRTTIATMSK